jgi:DNA-binding response OmpR family regulator
MRILVVEDDPQLSGLICEALEYACYAVDSATNGETAAELVAVNAYDLVVLDWGIPAPSGIELLRDWRRQGASLPVLMLTARDAVEDRVGGLDTGADDYLTKPFSFAELLARVRSLLRRRGQRPLVALEAGDVRLDRGKHLVTVAGSPTPVSPKEFAVLEYLLRRQDEVVTRTEIEEHVWNDEAEPMANVVDVVIHRLRKKIDGDRDERLIHTVRGVGYTLRGERS